MRLDTDKLAKYPLLPVLAGILSVFISFRLAAHRVPWSDLGVPILVAVTWSLIIWTALYYTPYIRRLTKSEAGMAGAAIVIVTMTWMDFPSSLFATSTAWVLLIVITMSKPSWRAWINRLGSYWILATLLVLVTWSGVITIQHRGSAGTISASNNTTDYPSIYLIIPDRFTSIDGLREFGGDPNELVQELEDLGFYVREDAMGNDITVGPKGATRTLKFLASVLNDGRDLPEDMTYNGVSKMVKTSSTMLSLKELGYRFYNVGSWFPESKVLAIADRNYSYARYDLMGLMFGSELAVAVVDRSFLREIDLSPILRNANFEVRRQEHLYQRDITVMLAQSYNQTKVVMTHLLLPHLPYVWGADGGEMPAGLSEWEAYLQQAEFTGGFLVEMAKGIVEADQDAIILIQSDEGILFNVSSGSAGLTKTQANGVLTAWRIPSGNSTLSEEELSGVAFTDILGFVRDLVTINNQAETELNG